MQKLMSDINKGLTDAEILEEAEVVWVVGAGRGLASPGLQRGEAVREASEEGVGLEYS